jgi:hypothetical protein
MRTLKTITTPQDIIITGYGMNKKFTELSVNDDECSFYITNNFIKGKLLLTGEYEVHSLGFIDILTKQDFIDSLDNDYFEYLKEDWIEGLKEPEWQEKAFILLENFTGDINFTCVKQDYENIDQGLDMDSKTDDWDKNEYLTHQHVLNENEDGLYQEMLLQVDKQYDIKPLSFPQLSTKIKLYGNS